MAFPASPTNGQTAVVNNITYQFSNVGNTWTRILSTANIITANTIAVNGALTVGTTIDAAGNVTANYFLGNVACASGIFTTKIFNGTSEANIGASGGNANISIGGTSNVAVFATTGEYITGVLSATGNVTGGNLITGGVISAASTVTGSTLIGTVVTATGNITGGNVLTSGLVSATSNITGGNILTDGVVSATGNVTGNYILGNGSQLTGLPATYGNSNVAAYLASGADTLDIITTANVSGGNVLSSGVVSAAGNIIGQYLLTSGSSGSISGTGNIYAGNLLTTGIVSAAGNIFGNGRNLTGINSFSTISVSGQSDVVADSITDTLTLAGGTGISITTDAATDTITIAYAASTSIFATGGTMGTVTEAVTQSQDLGNVADAVSGTTYDLGLIAVDGVVTNDNIAFYTITGDKLANNLVYSSNLSVTGNIVGAANISTSGNVIASANIYSANVIVPNQDQVVAYIFAF